MFQPIDFKSYIVFYILTSIACQATSVKYSVLIDAGSSKSQVFIFKWKDTANSNLLPTFQATKGARLEPGIASFSKNLNGLKDYLGKIITNTTHYIPEESIKTTNIYLMSTAGMRLLEEDKANDVMAEIHKTFSQPSFNPFLYSTQENTRVLSGEEEGVFSWLAVNYRNNKFSDTKWQDTLGVIEMGGASTQITFTTTASILANKFPVSISGFKFPLYAYSHLHYGQDYIEILIKQHLIAQNNNSKTYDHPCLVKGDQQIKDGKTFNGTGNSLECSKLLSVFVSKNQEWWRCNPKPCSIGSAYQPSLPASMTFHLVGAFRFTFDRINFTNKTYTKFSFDKLKTLTDKFCSLSKDEVMKQYPITFDKYLSLPCMVGNYVRLLLHHSYGFQLNTTQLKTDHDAEWTLGAMIYEYEKDKDLQCSKTAHSTFHPPRILILFFILVITLPQHF